MGYEERGALRRAQDAELDAALAELDADLPDGPEWRVVMALLRGAWPGDLTRAEELSYLTILNDQPPRDVARALRDLARAGQRFRPTPAEVRLTLGSGADPDEAPGWDEAWELCRYAGRRTSWNESDGLGLLQDEAPAVAAWARMRGLAAIWRLPTEDPDTGRFVLRDLAASYEAFAARWAVVANRPALAAGPGNRRGLRRLRPLGGRLSALEARSQDRPGG